MNTGLVPGRERPAGARIGGADERAVGRHHDRVGRGEWPLRNDFVAARLQGGKNIVGQPWLDVDLIGQPLIVHARRRHGIPDFRDPEPGSDGGMVIHLGSNVNPNSPQFQKAQQTCQNKTHGGKG